ncbi:BON domain-containing protein [Jeongeupia naejangsanensis]|uniref:BON domain-containing protein n=1 Tax=Jeongeupia naejangsanensis TaxID=613195 RepID=A0ABS2BMS0_9NEIS|nr:BON domain-containing protein [Jeongeupia naejangsanensis]MBM3116898.1 BON domain-containing protein [Jeongeupia naejangsanensis]
MKTRTKTVLIASLLSLGLYAQMALAASQNVQSDAQIAQAANTALQQNKQLKAFGLRAVSDRGVLTLQGTVDTPSTGALAVSVASGVDGVRDIRSDMRLPGGPLKI